MDARLGDLQKKQDEHQKWVEQRVNDIMTQELWISDAVRKLFPKQQRSLTELDKLLGTDPSGPPRRD